MLLEEISERKAPHESPVVSRRSIRFGRPRKRITPEALEHKKQACSRYLESTALDLDKVWSRKPDKEKADVLKVFRNGRNNWFCASSPSNQSPYLSFAQLFRANNWPKVAKELDIGTDIAPIHTAYAYVAAFCFGNEHILARVAQCLADTPISTTDIPHFYHLIDECRHTSNGAAGETLSRLLGLERQPRVKQSVQFDYVLPAFGLSDGARAKGVRPKHYHTVNAIQRTVMDVDKKAQKSVPVSEGFEVLDVGGDDSLNAVIQFMANGEYQKAVSKSTLLMATGRDLGDLLFHRAMALVMLHKYTDALVDIDRSIMLQEPKQNILQLRSVILTKLNMKATRDDFNMEESVRRAQRMMLSGAQRSLPIKWQWSQMLYPRDPPTPPC